MTARVAASVRASWLVLVILAAPALFAAEPSPIGRGVGQRVADFTLKNLAGEPVRLYSFRKQKAVVITFLGNDCPVANLYLPRLNELNKAYRDRGVVFLGVNANLHESLEQVTAHAKEHAIDFPVLKDPGNLVADLLLAERTCEVLVIDQRATVRYRGAIDDQYGQGARKPAPTHNYLADALDAVLAEKPVAVSSTQVAGCLLDRADPKPKRVSGPKVRRGTPRPSEEDNDKDVGPVNYAANVAGIVQDKCQSCHRPGESGPFSLLTYDDARRHSAMIREVVDDRRMPPWHADPRYGHFANDRSLTPRERDTLLAWVDQGTPLGNPKDLAAPRTFPGGWTIGKPDAVFELPEPYEVAAQGTLNYVYLRVPTHFKEDVWVQAAEARPGDRAVVHHILVFASDPAKNHRPRGEHLCAYAPGDMPSVYPPGTAKRIPAGSDLIFQLHYTPIGKRCTDRSKVGLIFAKEPVKHEVTTYGIAQKRFVIPPGNDNYTVRSSFGFVRDAQLLSLLPHMHLRGKSFEFTARYPDGRSEILLSVPAYDFGWQTQYKLAKPKAMPRLTQIECVAHFDNSDKNPDNPDPSKAVTWGDQTFDEMMIGYIDYIEDSKVVNPPKTQTRAAE